MLTDLILRLATTAAPPPEGAPDTEGHWVMVALFYGGLFAIFYFLLIRPQTKKSRETQDMQAALKKGDSVVTSGGMYGTVHKIKDDVITLQVADGVHLKFRKSAVTERVKESGQAKTDE